MRTRRPRKSSTGRPFGSLEAQVIRTAASLSEELDEYYQDLSLTRPAARVRRTREHYLGQSLRRSSFH